MLNRIIPQPDVDAETTPDTASSAILGKTAEALSAGSLPKSLDPASSVLNVGDLEGSKLIKCACCNGSDQHYQTEPTDNVFMRRPVQMPDIFPGNAIGKGNHIQNPADLPLAA